MLPSGRKRVALGLVAVAMGLSACGSGDEGTIPPEDADALVDNLDDLERAIESQDCTTAQTEIQQIETAVFNLPADVGVKTKEALRELSNNLKQLTEQDFLASEECVAPDIGPSGASGRNGPEDDG